MLRVGLTGGIGSGKSTVAQRFRELGAVVIDADQVAREVVTAGSTGLAAIRQRFGAGVTAPDGSLDRGALGQLVFADAQARKDLEAITHPLISARSRSLMDLARPQDIVVHDMPLLVELNMAAAYHLTVVVGADEDVRIARLTGARGLAGTDARARIAAQASDRERRAAADVWVDNNGDVEVLLAQVDALWHDRVVGFNENLMRGSAGDSLDLPDYRDYLDPDHLDGADSEALVAFDGSWPATAARLGRRVSLALGERAVAVKHIGPTSVPGHPARDVIDLQVGVRALTNADQPSFIQALADKGFPRLENQTIQRKKQARRLHVSADPGRPARVHVREHGSPEWEAALRWQPG